MQRLARGITVKEGHIGQVFSEIFWYRHTDKKKITVYFNKWVAQYLARFRTKFNEIPTTIICNTLCCDMNPQCDCIEAISESRLGFREHCGGETKGEGFLRWQKKGKGGRLLYLTKEGKGMGRKGKGRVCDMVYQSICSNTHTHSHIYIKPHFLTKSLQFICIWLFLYFVYFSFPFLCFLLYFS